MYIAFYLYIVPMVVCIISNFLTFKYDWYAENVCVETEEDFIKSLISSFVPILNIVVAIADIFYNICLIIEFATFMFLERLIPKLKKFVNIDHLE